VVEGITEGGMKMKKSIWQNHPQCDNCHRADKYNKPEWHADCSAGSRFNKSRTDCATGETIWSGWVVMTCTCNHEEVSA